MHHSGYSGCPLHPHRFETHLVHCFSHILLVFIQPAYYFLVYVFCIIDCPSCIMYCFSPGSIIVITVVLFNICFIINAARVLINTRTKSVHYQEMLHIAQLLYQVPIIQHRRYKPNFNQKSLIIRNQLRTITSKAHSRTWSTLVCILVTKSTKTYP